MDAVIIPSQYSKRLPHIESRPPLSDEEARLLKGLNYVTVEKNNKERLLKPVVQVYSLQFTNCTDDPQTIIGNISMGIPCFNDVLFDRQIGQESDHDVSPQGVVRLNGPKQMRVLGCNVLLYYKLFRNNQPGVLISPTKVILDDDEDDDEEEEEEDDDEDFYSLEETFLVCERTIEGLMLSGLELPYNKILHRSVRTTCGPMAVTYSIFPDGGDCFVSFKLLKWGRDECQSANVYGTVRASSTMKSVCDAESLVLDRKRDEHIVVRSGQFIPLHRPITLVPMGHHVKFDFCIMHRDMISEKDVVVVEGVVSFEPQCWFKSTDDKYISEYAEIKNEDFASVEVMVCWSPWWSR